MIGNLLLLEEIGKAFVPKFVRPRLRRYLLRAGVTDVDYRFFGAVFWLTFLLTAFVYILKLYPYLASQHLNTFVFFFSIFFFWVLFQGVIILVSAFSLYLYFEMKIYERTKKIDEVLPDFLRFVSENLKGGMSFENALWSSIKPEFGVLANEIRLAAKKVLTGTDVEVALHEFTEKYDSPTLKRSFDLMIEGLSGGGRVAGLIDKVVENIEETKELKSDLATTNLTYVIFVSFVAIFISPLLFALSAQFLNVLSSFSERIGGMGMQAASSMPVSFGGTAVKKEDFELFATYALATTAVFSSMIVALINKGNIREAVKYAPFFVAGSFLIHKLVSAVLTMFFGSLFI